MGIYKETSHMTSEQALFGNVAIPEGSHIELSTIIIDISPRLVYCEYTG
ncbi:hypothetical protein CJF30_00008724 [Rutstroemia sp. NJR-2017a BBW]|nr:hypothetical protein CJF30_00008724 [Rutstroemia sp. NJR-2017a BBW]